MKKYICLILLVLSTAVTAGATTLWGTTGDDVVNGGTLVAQNFDYNPKCSTKLQFVVSKTTGYRYLADILSGPGIAPGVQSGINEKGLVVTCAAVPFIKPSATAEARPGFAEWVLSSYGSVDDLLADKDKAGDFAPGYYMIADSGKIALIEIASRGQINVQEVTSGDLCYSKNYIAYSRIKELMAGHPGLFGLDDLVTYSQDRHNGPKNSLWRTGTTQTSERTLATWVVSLPDSGAPQAYIRLANTNEGKNGRLTLDDNFWSNQSAGDVSFNVPSE
ncbi:MAG: carcinine hydrolase/isopenicillin-N N-acyltransferase family protein [Sedimentisphaerales bacterium]